MIFLSTAFFVGSIGCSLLALWLLRHQRFIGSALLLGANLGLLVAALALLIGDVLRGVAG